MHERQTLDEIRRSYSILGVAQTAHSSNDPGDLTVFITSDALTSSDLLIAGWIGVGLGLYAFGDSLLPSWA
jgi:hypothetical protein